MDCSDLPSFPLFLYLTPPNEVMTFLKQLVPKEIDIKILSHVTSRIFLCFLLAKYMSGGRGKCENVKISLINEDDF